MVVDEEEPSGETLYSVPAHRQRAFETYSSPCPHLAKLSLPGWLHGKETNGHYCINQLPLPFTM